MWAVLLPPHLGLQTATCRTRKVVIDLTAPHGGSWLFHDQILSDSHKQSSQQADLGWNYASLLLRTHSLCSHGSLQCPDSKTTWWQRHSSSPEVPEGLLGDLVGGCQEAASWGSFRGPSSTHPTLLTGLCSPLHLGFILSSLFPSLFLLHPTYALLWYSQRLYSIHWIGMFFI